MCSTIWYSSAIVAIFGYFLPEGKACAIFNRTKFWHIVAEALSKSGKKVRKKFQFWRSSWRLNVIAFELSGKNIFFRKIWIDSLTKRLGIRWALASPGGERCRGRLYRPNQGFQLAGWRAKAD
jgi:hypothetical protein